MGTSISAIDPQNTRCTFAAPEPLAQVVLRNLAGDGCCPLDHLAEAREATTELVAFLLEHHHLPETVALELEAAQLAMAQAEVHLRMAAARCA